MQYFQTNIDVGPTPWIRPAEVIMSTRTHSRVVCVHVCVWVLCTVVPHIIQVTVHHTKGSPFALPLYSHPFHSCASETIRMFLISLFLSFLIMLCKQNYIVCEIFETDFAMSSTILRDPSKLLYTNTLLLFFYVWIFKRKLILLEQFYTYRINLRLYKEFTIYPAPSSSHY